MQFIVNFALILESLIAKYWVGIEESLVEWLVGRRVCGGSNVEQHASTNALYHLSPHLNAVKAHPR